MAERTRAELEAWWNALEARARSMTDAELTARSEELHAAMHWDRETGRYVVASAYGDEYTARTEQGVIADERVRRKPRPEPIPYADTPRPLEWGWPDGPTECELDEGTSYGYN